MAFVHCASGECAKSELDLFSPKPTQTSIENSFFMEVLPLAPLMPLAPIKFYVSGSTDMYLDLNNTLLHLVCEITKANGTNIEADTKGALMAYPIATMFNQVEINLGDRLIMQSDNMYAYRAYIESILNYSCEALDTQLPAGLFYKDTEAQFEDTTLDGGNNGFKKRASFVAGNRQFDLLGRIYSDLFFQDKRLVNGIDLKIKLNRNKGTFSLISGDAEQCKLVKLSTSLFIFSFPAGTRLTQQQNLFLGQLPKIIIIGFAASSRLYISNPFIFIHYDIKYAALVHEGAVIHAKPFTPSFGTSNFVREYLGLASITGKHLRDSGVVVSREGYGTRYTLFASDLTPDLEDGEHYNLIKNGNLKAEIRFTQALATNVKMIVFSIFHSVIQVNHARQLMFDYH
ncbi:uncharacterized protein F54H12.2-like [Pleurodeles waltl]|uniref:uncharacterized protein F54H12.2-like n=1 Tax=Pleurodeles waltl TaxID=8319 RepID=UPI003709B925